MAKISNAAARVFRAFVWTAAMWLIAHPAGASTISFSDVFNPDDVFFGIAHGATCTGNDVLDTVSGAAAISGGNGGCSTLAWTQTLPGFNAGTDTLTTGS